MSFLSILHTTVITQHVTLIHTLSLQVDNTLLARGTSSRTSPSVIMMDYVVDVTSTMYSRTMHVYSVQVAFED